MKKTDCQVIIFYPSPAFGGVRCGCECHMLTQYPWGSNLPLQEASLRCIRICVHLQFLEYGQHSVETCEVLYMQKEIIQQELTRGSLSIISPNINQWRAIIWWDVTTCRMGSTRAMMVRLESVHLNGHRRASQPINLHIDNVPGAPPPEEIPDEETIDHQKPVLTCTPDLTKTRAHEQVVGVENRGGKAYGKATGLYNKHWKYWEYLNPWYPFQLAHDIQQAQSFSQQMKIWINQHLRRGLENFRIESFQSADALRKLISEIDFGLGENGWIEDHLHIFGTLYYRIIFKCIHLLLAQLPFQAHLDFEPMRLTDSESLQI